VLTGLTLNFLAQKSVNYFSGFVKHPKFAQQILVFISLFLSPGGEAAELKTERNLNYTVLNN
jgi:hypothetical protein